MQDLTVSKGSLELMDDRKQHYLMSPIHTERPTTTPKQNNCSIHSYPPNVLYTPATEGGLTFFEPGQVLGVGSLSCLADPPAPACRNRPPILWALSLGGQLPVNCICAGKSAKVTDRATNAFFLGDRGRRALQVTGHAYLKSDSRSRLSLLAIVFVQRGVLPNGEPAS
jgi:hypothetical protein